MFTVYSCHRCFLVKLDASFHWFRLHLDVFHSNWVAPQRAWASYSNTAKSPVVCDTNTTMEVAEVMGTRGARCCHGIIKYRLCTIQLSLITVLYLLLFPAAGGLFVITMETQRWRRGLKAAAPQSSRLLNVVTDVCSCRSLLHSIQSTSWTKAWRSSSRRSGEASTWSPTSLRSSTCSDQRRSNCWFVEAGWEFY